MSLHVALPISIGPGPVDALLAARGAGERRDLGRPFEADATLSLVTAKDEADALELVRHDFAHVLAEAVQALFPGTQITFGPSTDDGFYYDFAPRDRPFTDEDLRSEEHTSELQSLMRISYAVFCLKKKKTQHM